MSLVIQRQLLNFWFEPINTTNEHAVEQVKLWLDSNENFNYDIERRYGKLVSLARSGAFDSWQQSTEGSLALVLLLALFPRYIFGTSDQSSTSNTQAVAITKRLIEMSTLTELKPIEQAVVLLPLTYSDCTTNQQLAKQHYQVLLKNQQEQQSIIELFL